MLEDPIKLITELENNLASFAMMESLNLSFQEELKSFFPDIVSNGEDYTDELEENCFSKNIPKEFITGFSLNELNRLYQHMSGSTNSYEDEDSTQNVQLPGKFKNYKISFESIIMGEEKRTMIVVRNIPQHYTPRTLFEEICSNFYGKFNYFYLPYNSQLKKNNGYALLNFISSFHILSFFDFYNKKSFKKYQNKRKLDIFFSKFTFEKDIQKDSKAYTDILIPLKYMEIVRKLYSHSVCIIKEQNIYGEGHFLVKSLGKRFV